MEADSYQKENFMGDRKNDIHISRNIARLRRKMGLTQTELAERLYVSNKTVSKWERGAGYPETPQLVRLADLFGVTLDTLIRGEKSGIAVAGNILTDEVKIIESFPGECNVAGLCNPISRGSPTINVGWPLGTNLALLGWNLKSKSI